MGVHENRIFRRFRKIAKQRQLCHVCLSVRQSFSSSVRMDKLGYRRTDVHKILYLGM